MLHARLMGRINLVHVVSLVGYSGQQNKPDRPERQDKPDELEPNGNDITSRRGEVGIMPQYMVASAVSPQMDTPEKDVAKNIK